MILRKKFLPLRLSLRIDHKQAQPTWYRGRIAQSLRSLGRRLPTKSPSTSRRKYKTMPLLKLESKHGVAHLHHQCHREAMTMLTRTYVLLSHIEPVDGATAVKTLGIDLFGGVSFIKCVQEQAELELGDATENMSEAYRMLFLARAYHAADKVKVLGTQLFGEIKID